MNKLQLDPNSYVLFTMHRAENTDSKSNLESIIHIFGLLSDLRVPCVTIRKSTEWVETVAAGWNLVTGIDERKIIRACHRWLPTKRYRPIFGNGRTSQIIKDLISNM